MNLSDIPELMGPPVCIPNCSRVRWDLTLGAPVGSKLGWFGIFVAPEV